MRSIRFILKNGCSFTVQCVEAEVTIADGEITGYKLSGIILNRPLFIDIEQIAAVISENPLPEKKPEE